MRKGFRMHLRSFACVAAAVVVCVACTSGAPSSPPGSAGGEWDGTCTYVGRCPDNPEPADVVVKECETLLASPCASLYRAWFSCIARAERCGPDGRTDHAVTDPPCADEKEEVRACVFREGLAPADPARPIDDGGARDAKNDFPDPPPNPTPGCGSFGMVGGGATSCEACYATFCCANKRACANEPECLAYYRCLSTCQGATCNACGPNYPIGEVLAQSLASCLSQKGVCVAECDDAYLP